MPAVVHCKISFPPFDSDTLTNRLNLDERETSEGWRKLGEFLYVDFETLVNLIAMPLPRPSPHLMLGKVSQLSKVSALLPLLYACRLTAQSIRPYDGHRGTRSSKPTR